MLLISDLGRPERFLNMLRVFKVTSPMSVGSWILVVSGGTGERRRRARGDRHPAAAEVARGARLVRDRAAARDLHGRAAREHGDPGVERGARRAAVRLRLERVRERRRGGSDLHDPRVGGASPPRRSARLGARARRSCTRWRDGSASSARSTGRARPASTRRSRSGLVAAGAGLLALGGRRSRAAAVAGGALVLAGELALRWSIFKAGFQSARDPKYTVVPQKARKAQREAATTAVRGSRSEPRS